MILKSSSKSDANEDVTKQLCAWVNQLSLSDIPDDVRTRAKYLILDGFGCAIVGAHLPWSEKAAEAIFQMESPGNCTVWGYDKVNVQLNTSVNCTLMENTETWATPRSVVNSTEIQAFELDDWHSLAPVHSNSILLPALLAVTSHQRANGAPPFDGAALLLSTIVGYETGPRVGLCLHGSHMLTRGWHSGVVFGHAASAAAVSKVLGLHPHAIEDALGIACTQACGLMSAQFGSDVKRMQHGFAARNGLFAALLAKSGYVGIKKVFEEPYGGFLATFGQGSGKEPPYLVDELVKDLGRAWQLESIRVKPHASMAGTHCTIDTVEALQKKHPAKLMNLADVVSIKIEMSEPAFKHGGWEAHRPLTATGAQMSCAYAAAVQLVDAQVSPKEFQSHLLDRDTIWDLVGKTKCVHSPELGGKYEQRVTIQFINGDNISETVDAPKGVNPPLSNEEILAKFRKFTKGLIDDKRRTMIEKLVLDMENLEDISVLDDLLASVQPLAN